MKSKIDELVERIKKQDADTGPMTKVKTTDEYTALHIEQREVPHWLWRRKYLTPYGLMMHDEELEGTRPICSEWDLFYKFIKTNYPIQYFFRETLPDAFSWVGRRISWKYYEIRDRMFPRQRWLLKKLPRHWQDKKSMSVDVLYAMIEHFIEIEDALNVINWESDPEHHTFKNGLIDCYKWIKTDRSELMEKMAKELNEGVPQRRRAYKTMGHTIDAYNVVYGPYNDMEKQLEETDTEMCIWIIKNRHFLWT